MNPEVQRYLAQIGRKGGSRSRRRLDGDEARRMVLVREARRAYRRFHGSCFWFRPPDYKVASPDIPWVVEGLRRYGNRQAWEVASRLCRLQNSSAQ
jgi:hypothetical protein